MQDDAIRCDRIRYFFVYLFYSFCTWKTPSHRCFLFIYGTNFNDMNIKSMIVLASKANRTLTTKPVRYQVG